MNDSPLNSWIKGICLHWMERLPQTSAGFAESVVPLEGKGTEWRAGPETALTMLTQARIVYTFLRCHPEEKTLLFLDRMIQTFWDEDAKGWIRSCTPEGAPLDRTIDTYDQPFGLLALSEAYRACKKLELGDRSVGDRIMTHIATSFLRDLAFDTLEGLDRFARDPQGGGYWERRNGTTPSPMVVYPQYRRQNPHMHLLEAFLAWQEVDPPGPWMAHARELVELFRMRFRSPETGYLAEYFDDRWNLASGDAGRVREPGHQYEWVWLLDWYGRLSGDPSVRKEGEFLYRFAWEKGTDPEDGLAYAVVDDRGEVVDGGKLLWPQTEMLKAHGVMYRWTGDTRYRSIAEEAYRRIQRKFMRGESPLFYNRLDRTGAPDPAPALSRLLYHLYGGAVVAEEDEALSAR